MGWKREKKGTRGRNMCRPAPVHNTCGVLAKIPGSTTIVLGAGVRLSLKVPAAAWRPGQGPDPARFQVPFRKATVTSEPPTDFVFGTEEREVRVPLEPQRHPAPLFPDLWIQEGAEIIPMMPMHTYYIEGDRWGDGSHAGK